jgi:FtsZ-binding cell division protein ZapB
MGKKNQTRAQFQKKTLELKKKVKQTTHNATLCDRMIRELRSSQQNISQQLEEKQRSCQELRSSVESIDAEIEELQEASITLLACRSSVVYCLDGNIEISYILD